MKVIKSQCHLYGLHAEMSHVPCSVPVVSQSISFKEIASGVYFFALTLQWLKMLYTVSTE